MSMMVNLKERRPERTKDVDVEGAEVEGPPAKSRPGRLIRLVQHRKVRQRFQRPVKAKARKSVEQTGRRRQGLIVVLAGQCNIYIVS